MLVDPVASASLAERLLEPARPRLDDACAIAESETDTSAVWAALIARGLVDTDRASAWRFEHATAPGRVRSVPHWTVEAILFAASAAEMAVVERLAYEAQRRLAPYGFAPVTRVTWQTLRARVTTWLDSSRDPGLPRPHRPVSRRCVAALEASLDAGSIAEHDARYPTYDDNPFAPVYWDEVGTSASAAGGPARTTPRLGTSPARALVAEALVGRRAEWAGAFGDSEVARESPFEPIFEVWARGFTFTPTATGEIVLGLPETDYEILACVGCGRIVRVATPSRFGLVAGEWCPEHGPVCGECVIDPGAWSNDALCCVCRGGVVGHAHRPDP